MPQSPVVPRFSEQPDDFGASGGRGCNGYTIVLLAMSVIVLALMILALFLPPFSLWNSIEDRLNHNEKSTTPSGVQIVDGLAFMTMNAEVSRVNNGGLTITVPPGQFAGAFGVYTSALAPADYLAGNTPESGWFCGTVLPPGHALASPVYSLAQIGTTPVHLTVQVSALPDAASDPAALELDVWNADGQVWNFIAAGADESGTIRADLTYLPRCLAMFRQATSTRLAGVTLGLRDRFMPDMMAADVQLYPGSLRPTLTGALQVILAPGFQTGQGYDVLPLLQNFDDPAVVDVVTVQSILENSALRTEHARQIAAFVLSDPGYTGIVIDYREVPPNLRDAYSAFLRDLADLLHGQGRTLTVVLPFPADTINTGAYDWLAIGRVADEVVVLGPLDPLAYVPDGPVDQALDWAATQVSRGNLALGLEALSVEDQGDGVFAPIGITDALSYLGDVALDPSGPVGPGQTVTVRLNGVPAVFGMDETSQTAYVRYLDADGNPLRTMWITGPDALYFRVERAIAHQLGGLMVRNLMLPGVVSGLDTALLAYRLDQPLMAAPDSGFEWAVLAGDSVVAQAPATGEPFTFQVGDIEGTLAVEARVAGRTVSRATIQIAAPEPMPTVAPTATPLPTATPEPTLEPTLTPTLAAVPTQTAIPQVTVEALPQPVPTTESEPLPTEIPLNVTPVDLTQPLPSVDPAVLAGANVGTAFEVGVQMAGVTRDIVFAGRMHAKWIKFDVRYLLGQDAAAQQQLIDETQANGFKVLLNVTGDPFEFAGTDRATYIAAYAAYVGALSANGADGIEVWHEMNGRMTAQEYVQLLAYAYQAIKTADPDTLVISGALKPVANAENPDDNTGAYYARLAEASVARYADCIGTQYVLGMVPPASASGDPRGDSPIYYLPTASDGPRAAAAGVLPVCYTRLGYLSPEGYPPLPEDYAWAQGITAAQQAQWTADAIRLGKEGSQARLVIIWSLDAAYFGGGSPEAGYAIIRPDGTCPACDLIEPLLKEPGS
jgi:hypothetical protein